MHWARSAQVLGPKTVDFIHSALSFLLPAACFPPWLSPPHQTPVSRNIRPAIRHKQSSAIPCPPTHPQRRRRSSLLQRICSPRSPSLRLPAASTATALACQRTQVHRRRHLVIRWMEASRQAAQRPTGHPRPLRYSAYLDTHAVVHPWLVQWRLAMHWCLQECQPRTGRAGLVLVHLLAQGRLA